MTRIKAAAALAAAALLPTALAATPAQAALAACDCPSGYSCYWTGLNGTGQRWVAPTCGTHYLNEPFKDNIYSAKNGGSDLAIMYQLSNGWWELKGYLYPGEQGNFHAYTGMDVVAIDC
ncbi:peptidase inhibitor family I36 protein [Actinoplanes couchii]|uniref:Peptidase inhibitor family I36 n=1 Tax=Actinoplanes couchii TaxID=403638 RepID=A0ABQ3XM57_9ACTN|nr:peptidase inhibitor family I36 protein [Actinoplanes couchii]MDR6319205.1 hypothetical protein [Actinoplanes couchii]GID59584.1 hypothetical protein Aco03nite_079880 [Actinoplanes couchii]